MTGLYAVQHENSSTPRLVKAQSHEAALRAWLKWVNETTHEYAGTVDHKKSYKNEHNCEEHIYRVKYHGIYHNVYVSDISHTVLIG